MVYLCNRALVLEFRRRRLEVCLRTLVAEAAFLSAVVVVVR